MKLLRRLQPAALLLAALAATACEPRNSARGGAAAADTAAWTLSAEPVAQAGEMGRTALYRVYSGYLAPDGGFVVGNSGTGQVLFFAADGRLARATGRRGAGPGEFQSVSWVHRLPGDSTLVFDMRGSRFSVLDGAGRYARSFSARIPGRSLRPLAVYPDGTLLMAEEGRFDPRRAAGLLRDSMALFRMDRQGGIVDTLATLPGSEWVNYGDGSSYRTTQLTFGRTGHVALTGDRLVYGSSEAPELTVRPPGAAPETRLRLPVAPRRLESAELDAHLDEMVQGLRGAQRDATLRTLREIRLPTDAPLFTELRGDRAQHLWVQLAAPHGARSARWVVFAPDGRAAGSVLLPAGARLLDVEGDRVLLKLADADDEETVAIYRVNKP
ncbi:MAG TPA: hypothetical protein VHG08_02265 [Longimicrobium sp.]|nr:hypothetical protein [Longimicrobium sp.]